MSLSALSTELDTKIVAYLTGDTSALSAFSQVSKYYRDIAEPYLYKDIALLDRDDHTMKQLFCILLARKQLARQISSISVQQSLFGIVPSNRERINTALWESADNILTTMNDFASLSRGYQEGASRRNAWFSGIFSTHLDSLDHILAVILCISPNLRSLDLQLGHQPFAYTQTQSILYQPWIGADAPLGKVTALKLSGHATDHQQRPLLPSMTSFELRHASMVISSGPVPIFRPLPLFEPSPMPTKSLLRRMILVSVADFTPQVLEEMVDKLSLRNLQELVIDKCGRVLPGVSWDLDGLTRTLKEGTPNLESLRWTSQYVDTAEEYPRFKCLNILDKLHTLHVDFDLLVPLDDEYLDALADPHAVFPPHLHDLTLDGCNTNYLNRLIDKLHIHIEGADDQTEEINMAVTWLASKFPLKRLALSVSLDSRDSVSAETLPVELEPSDVVFFRYAADVLLRTGLVFEVVRKPQRFDDVAKVLVKHGYTAPVPHSFEWLYQELEDSGPRSEQWSD
jgi:hypothetical protein